MPIPPARLSVDFASGRDAFIAQTHRFLTLAEQLDDHALLAASRCHGWAVLDVVVHVRAGLDEMLRGITAPTSAQPTVDAASYWTAFAADDADNPIDGILWTRRTASAYRSPHAAVRHLRDTADAVAEAVLQMGDGAVRFQGHVLTVGDFLATWAVELAVHHLDLGRDLDVGGVDPQALGLARRTIEVLLGRTGLDEVAEVNDVDVVLVGAGRKPAMGDGPLHAVLG